MMTRLVAAFLVVGCLTAFAPAPFPKQQKAKKEVDDRAQLQGLWKVTNYERPGLKNNGVAVKIRSAITNVRIEKGQWSFLRELNGKLTPTVTYDLKVDPGTSPRKMEMTRDMNGSKYVLNAIYKFDGTQLKVMYSTMFVAKGGGAQPKQPALSFEDPPSNAILYTLERTR